MVLTFEVLAALLQLCAVEAEVGQSVNEVAGRLGAGVMIGTVEIGGLDFISNTTLGRSRHTRLCPVLPIWGLHIAIPQRNKGNVCGSLPMLE